MSDPVLSSRCPLLLRLKGGYARCWWRSCLVAFAVLAPLPACGGDCGDEIEAARKFLSANLSCEVDTDCVAVNTGCHTFANGLCSQAPLNREAAETAEWKRLSSDLTTCEDECAHCAALLVPTCTEGVCGRAP